MEAANPGPQADAWAGGSHWRDRPSLSLIRSPGGGVVESRQRWQRQGHFLHSVRLEEDLQTEHPRMTLEQARATMWLRDNYRPMGELFDEGYLDQARLEWAAQRAYDPRIKQAAVLFLGLQGRAPAAPLPPEKTAVPTGTALVPQEETPAIHAGLTIAQAWTTPWPFRPYRAQEMGPLVETRRLRLKDLVYAIENARENRVRQAAVALMAVSLNQVVEEPPVSAGPLHVVSSGRSYAERQQLNLTLWVGLGTGVALGAALQPMINSALRGGTSSSKASWNEIISSPASIIGLAILLAGTLIIMGFVVAASDLLSQQIVRIREAYRQGQEGETRVVEVLCHVLDGSWTLFRNVVLPGYRSDLDLVLVGPAGVWVLEAKTLSGEYRNVGERWEYKAGRRWKPLQKSPGRQARNNAGRLAGFLQADKVKQWVEAAVVWANPESALTVENPMVAVWTLDRLPDELGNLWQDRRLDEATQVRIVEKLRRLGQKKERR